MNEEILARFERRSREKRARISSFMNKQYSNCFSQREIILADHFYKLANEEDQNEQQSKIVNSFKFENCANVTITFK